MARQEKDRPVRHTQDGKAGWAGAGAKTNDETPVVFSFCFYYYCYYLFSSLPSSGLLTSRLDVHTYVRRACCCDRMGMKGRIFIEFFIFFIYASVFSVSLLTTQHTTCFFKSFFFDFFGQKVCHRVTSSTMESIVWQTYWRNIIFFFSGFSDFYSTLTWIHLFCSFVW